MNVKDLDTLPDGMPVVDLVGTLTGVGKKFANQGQQGTWYRQPATLTDESGGRVGLSLSSDSVESAAHIHNGAKVRVSASKGARGLYGAAKSIYKGETQVRVREDHVTALGDPPAAAAEEMTGVPFQLGAPTEKFTKPYHRLTEAEANDLIIRTAHTIFNGLGGIGTDADPVVVAALLRASTAILIGVQRGEIEREKEEF